MIRDVPAKIVSAADGSEFDYRTLSDSEPFCAGINTLEAAWIDEEGNHW